jgi:channel protein (hemolysin III family)
LQLYHLPGFHEPFSAISHLIGAVAFSVLGVRLLQRCRVDNISLAFLGIYAVSCVLLFSLSGVYHMVVRGGAAHRVIERLDHGAIFVLIAGTFTPVHGLLFRGLFRWVPLLLIWAVALAGITLKTVFFDDLAEWVGFSSYLLLGWFGVPSIIFLARRHGVALIKPLMLGGLAYTVGGVMDFFGWLVVVPGVVHAHEVFHLAVLVGAWFHWCFVWQLAAGEISAPRHPPHSARAASPLGPPSSSLPLGPILSLSPEGVQGQGCGDRVAEGRGTSGSET